MKYLICFTFLWYTGILSAQRPIFDLNGPLTIATIKVDYLQGEHELSFNVDGFPPGIYFLEMITSYGAGAQKFVIGNK